MMKSVCIALLVLVAVTSEAADVASLGFEKIEPLLRELVFSKPQYADLKKQSDAVGDIDRSSFMKTDEKGNIVLGKEHLQQAAKMTSRFEIDRLIQDAMRRELVLLIDGMDLSHVIVVNADESNAILHSKAEIEDITQKLYQKLVTLLSDR